MKNRSAALKFEHANGQKKVIHLWNFATALCESHENISPYEYTYRVQICHCARIECTRESGSI